jgi:hypothetical protein
MRKLVAPLAAAGALLWLPGQAALGKRPSTRSWAATTPTAHRNGALRRTPCAQRVQKGPGEEVSALRTAKTSSSAPDRTTSWIS